MMGRTVLLYNRVPMLEEIFELIDQTTAPKLQRIAGEIFDEKQLTYLTMIPSEEKQVRLRG